MHSFAFICPDNPKEKQALHKTNPCFRCIILKKFYQILQSCVLLELQPFVSFFLSHFILTQNTLIHPKKIRHSSFYFEQIKFKVIVCNQTNIVDTVLALNHHFSAEICDTKKGQKLSEKNLNLFSVLLYDLQSRK